ncbi:hypothetical protein LXL04_018784 [Taraxacum kok-saghyz]
MRERFRETLGSASFFPFATSAKERCPLFAGGKTWRNGTVPAGLLGTGSPAFLGCLAKFAANLLPLHVIPFNSSSNFSGFSTFSNRTNAKNAPDASLLPAMYTSTSFPSLEHGLQISDFVASPGILEIVDILFIVKDKFGNVKLKLLQLVFILSDIFEDHSQTYYSIIAVDLFQFQILGDYLLGQTPKSRAFIVMHFLQGGVTEDTHNQDEHKTLLKILITKMNTKHKSKFKINNEQFKINNEQFEFKIQTPKMVYPDEEGVEIKLVKWNVVVACKS